MKTNPWVLPVTATIFTAATPFMMAALIFKHIANEGLHARK